MNFLYKPLPLLGLITLLGILIYGGIQWFRPDPQTAFQKEVKQLIASVNQAKHQKVDDYLSPAFHEMLQEHGLTSRQAILIAYRRDTEGRHEYRLVDNPIFQHKDYAEVLIERSGRLGNFNQARAFAVPWIWIDGGWKVAGDFRSEQYWDDPF